MHTLLAVYWFCFGTGLLYVLVSGALGAFGHMHGGGGGDASLDGHDFDGGAGSDGHSLEAGHGEAGGELQSADLEGNDSELLQQGDGVHAAHAHAHAGAHESGDAMGASYSPFSALPIAGTICGLGAGGLITSSLGWPLPLSLLGALAGGVISALLLWLVIGKLLYSMQGSSEGHVADMLGLEATVLTPVEPEASGEIAYILDGTRYTAPARLLGEGKVAQHETVRIRRMKDNIVYVERKGKLLD